MKRMTCLLAIVLLLFSVVGCGTPEDLFDGSESTEKTDTSITKDMTADAPENRLPDVNYLFHDSDVRFTDVADLANGGFVIAGHKETEDLIYSTVQLFDKNMNFQEEYAFENGNGFDKIAVCSDGGLIAASYSPPCLTKINSAFEWEWFMPYEDVAFEGWVQDVEELSPDCFAVLFVSVNAPNFQRTLKLSFLNKAGELVETIDLMKNIDPSDADIVPDGNGGFYLLSACNQSLADTYPLVLENYEASKATEVAVLRFSADRELLDVKTVGGGGNDWIEEGAVDSDGNIYLAMGTDWDGADAFWKMNVDSFFRFRRMLVKMDKNGEILYKVPLANKGMAVDQVFGIHIREGKAYVVGMSDYFDGYQTKYPCEEISAEEEYDRVFCVYTACIGGKGDELYRKVFRCDINNTPCDSTVLSNGALMIAGSVSSEANSFGLLFPSGVTTTCATFVYKGLP